MLDKEAIEKLSEAQAIAAAARATEDALDSSTPVVHLPQNFGTCNLEKYMPRRTRARGAMETRSVSDFVEYAVMHAETGACIFVDQDAFVAIAVLNLGDQREPGHADNIAKLRMKKTAAYDMLRNVADGHLMTQSQVAEFFEDWLPFLRFTRNDADVPPGQAIAAVRKITIEAARKVQSEEQQLSTNRTTFEKVSADGDGTIPTHISFTCNPYSDLKSRIFVMRLAISTGNDKVGVTLRVAKIEEHEERMADELCCLIEEQVGSQKDVSLPVFVGTYAARP